MMEIHLTTEINRPVHQVWQALAEDFTQVAQWHAPVKKSYELPGVKKMDHASCSGRICEFTDKPDGFKASEKIRTYDAKNHLLEVDVDVLNAPAFIPVTKNFARFQLKVVNANTTLLEFCAIPELKVHGYVMYPLLKMGLANDFSKLLKGLKRHVEQAQLAAA